MRRPRAAWLHGDFAGSIRRYGDILLDYPRDLLALQVAHVGDFFLGASRCCATASRRCCRPGTPSIAGLRLRARHVRLRPRGDRAVLARRGHRPARARASIRATPWAVHAVTHVMEMQGRLRDGIDWLTARENGLGARTTASRSTTGGTWRCSTSKRATTPQRARALRPAHPRARFAGAARDDRRSGAAVAAAAARRRRRRPLAETRADAGSRSRSTPTTRSTTRTR